VVKAEAEILKGAFNIATFIPKHILAGLSENTEKEYKGKQSIKTFVGSGAKLEDINDAKIARVFPSFHEYGGGATITYTHDKFPLNREHGERAVIVTMVYRNDYAYFIFTEDPFPVVYNGKGSIFRFGFKRTTTNNIIEYASYNP
jgi:hypothetical protein